MAFSAAVIAQTVKYVRDNRGIQPSYVNGQWFLPSSRNGNPLAVSPQTATQFDALAAAFRDQQLAKRSGTTPPPIPTIPPPDAPIYSSAAPSSSPGASSDDVDPSSPTYIPPDASLPSAGPSSGSSPTSDDTSDGGGTNWWNRLGGVSSPAFTALRAVMPMHYRGLLRRATQGYRAAQSLQTAGMQLNGAANAGIGAVGGFALGDAFGGTVGGIGGALGGAAGGALGGPIGAAIGAPIGTAIAMAAQAAVTRISSNIHDTAQSGSQIADNLTRGIRSAGNDVYKAGADLAQNVVSALTRPFGVSGAAVSSLFGSVLKSGGNLLGGGLDALGGVAHAAGGIAGAGLGIAGTAGGALAGLMLAPLIGPLGVGIGAVVGSAVGAGIGKVLVGVSDLAGGLLSTFGRVFGEIASVGGAAFKSLVDVIQDVSGAASQFAKNAASIRGYTGLSYGAAGGLAQDFGAFNLSPMSLASRTDPAISHIQNGIFGVSGYTSPDFLTSYASRYQSMMGGGLMGRMMAHNLARMNGMDSPEGAAFSMLPVQKIQSQLDYSRGINTTLGLNPGALKGYAEDFTLLQGRVGIAVDAIKLKLGEELLPYITRGLQAATSWVAAHAGDIAGWFQKGTAWIFQTMPRLMINAASVGLGAVENATRTLAGHVPALLRFFDILINGIRSFLRIGVYSSHFPNQAAGRAAVAQFDRLLPISNLAGGEAARQIYDQQHPNDPRTSLKYRLTSAADTIGGAKDNIKDSALSRYVQGQNTAADESNLHLSRIAKATEETAALQHIIAEHTRIMAWLHNKAAQGHRDAQDLVADMANRQKYQINRAISNLGG